MSSFKDFCSKKTVIGLGLGQFLSLLTTFTGSASSELAKRGINAPTSQSFINYVLLAIVYGSIVLYRKKALKAKWYFYVPLGLVDVEANYLVVKAYQYTSLTSVMLLDCWTIPCVMLLTWLFLKTKYRFRKIAGVVVCVAGGTSPLKGDALVIAAATLYAVTNVSEEFLVKNADRVELMAMLGTFGAIVSAIQIGITERNELKSIRWTAGAVSGSTMLNLSLLTSDMWSIVIRVIAYNEMVDWLYYLAFAVVVIGLIIYSVGEKEEDQRRADIADEESEHDKHAYKKCPSRN
ncbi:Solute carrier family 35 member F1 [Cucurbita argyrosperma subsp. argyrosperma]|nr:Solute carrier family 35 member F1 [Cucurbita argyrosperma subsp. argyrosperma]